MFLDRQTIVPLGVAMQGVRIRIPLTREEADRGVLCLPPGCFRRQGVAHRDMHLLAAAGGPLASRVVTLKQQVTGPLGSFTQETPAFGSVPGTAPTECYSDSVLVTIEDWQHGRFRLEHEPANQRRQQDSERQNQELANVLFALEAARNEQLFAHQAIPGLCPPVRSARLSRGPLVEVIANDARMQWDGFSIHYNVFVRRGTRCCCWHSRRSTLLPGVLYAGTSPPGLPLHRSLVESALWRRLEIQGGQTLADFDAILREAFRHDVRSPGGLRAQGAAGDGQRFREVGLGDIDPSEAAAVPVSTSPG